MKISRHDQEGTGEGGWGQLLGIQHQNNYIEVSDCYPLLTKDLKVTIDDNLSKNMAIFSAEMSKLDHENFGFFDWKSWILTLKMAKKAKNGLKIA